MGERDRGVPDLEFHDYALGVYLDRMAGGRRPVCRIPGDHESDRPLEMSGK